MRTFIAIELPIEAKNEIMRIQKTLWKKTLFSGKLTESENLHLTLKFLGEVNDDKIDEIKNKLSEIKVPEFFAEIGGIGVFNKNFIKIIWVKLNGKGIWELQKEIDNKLAGMFERERRFMGHVTIARVKNVPDKRCFLEYLKSVTPKKIRFLVKDFALKKSELKPEGPEYSSIESYNLIREKI